MIHQKDDPNQSMKREGSLVRIGRGLFGFRLLVGLGITAIGLELLTPKPFFANGQRLTQATALALIAAGLALRAWAAGYAGGHTRSDDIEAPLLVTAGPFAYLRNPIYAGSICLGLGMVMLIGDPLAFVLAGAAFLILYVAIVPAEEAFLLRKFGEEYVRYRSAVPRFFPLMKPWDGSVERAFDWRATLGEGGIALLLVLIYSALWFEEYLDKFWG
jgi:protein-S-isoprenylcysteine O-methyltransferase Ste14